MRDGFKEVRVGNQIFYKTEEGYVNAAGQHATADETRQINESIGTMDMPEAQWRTYQPDTQASTSPSSKSIAGPAIIVGTVLLGGISLLGPKLLETIDSTFENIKNTWNSHQAASFPSIAVAMDRQHNLYGGLGKDSGEAYKNATAACRDSKNLGCKIVASTDTRESHCLAVAAKYPFAGRFETETFTEISKETLSARVREERKKPQPEMISVHYTCNSDALRAAASQRVLPPYKGFYKPSGQVVNLFSEASYNAPYKGITSSDLCVKVDDVAADKFFRVTITHAAGTASGFMPQHELRPAPECVPYTSGLSAPAPVTNTPAAKTPSANAPATPAPAPVVPALTKIENGGSYITSTPTLLWKAPWGEARSTFKEADRSRYSDLASGTCVRVTDTDTHRILAQVRLPDGQQGWVEKLKLNPAPDCKTAASDSRQSAPAAVTPPPKSQSVTPQAGFNAYTIIAAENTALLRAPSSASGVAAPIRRGDCVLVKGFDQASGYTEVAVRGPSGAPVSGWLEELKTIGTQSCDFNAVSTPSRAPNNAAAPTAYKLAEDVIIRSRIAGRMQNVTIPRDTCVTIRGNTRNNGDLVVQAGVYDVRVYPQQLIPAPECR